MFVLLRDLHNVFSESCGKTTQTARAYKRCYHTAIITHCNGIISPGQRETDEHGSSSANEHLPEARDRSHAESN